MHWIIKLTDANILIKINLIYLNQFMVTYLCFKRYFLAETPLKSPPNPKRKQPKQRKLMSFEYLEMDNFEQSV